MECKLCKNDFEKLCKSHIASKLFYRKLLKAANYKMSTLKKFAKRDKIIRVTQQDGVKDNAILCEECEGVLSKIETHCANYALPKIYDHISGKKHKIPSVTEITGINYMKFKLLILSVLWRASVSNLPEFREVSLGETHENNIREIILTNRELEITEYGIIIFEVISFGPDWEYFVDAFPHKGKVKGHNCYQLILGGIKYFVFISNHDLPEGAAKLMISPVKFPIVHSGKLGILERTLKQINKYG
ncbi:MAG: hypothetical protein ACYS8W_14245 [Planctomycetota bacterium]